MAEVALLLTLKAAACLLLFIAMSVYKSRDNLSTSNLKGSTASLGKASSHGNLQTPLDKERLTGPNAQYWRLAEKFTQFKPEEIEQFISQFKAFDKDGSLSIDVHELGQVCKELGESFTVDELTKKIAEVDMNKSNTVEFDEFLQVILKLREGKVGADRGFGAVYQKQAKLFKVGGATDSTTHSINEEEQEQFCIHINQALKDDNDVKDKVPIDPKSFEDLYHKVSDGLILAKLINSSVPDTIDERVLNKGLKINPFQKTENQNVVVNSAKAIGCSVVNIGAQDLIDGRPHLVLGIVWQIIKIGLFAMVDLAHHPELFRLLEPGESLEDFLKLPVDQILLRWFNYHLKKAGWKRRVQNFSGDIKDVENYTVLLAQLCPEHANRSPLDVEDMHQRAEKFLGFCDKMGVRKYVTPKAIVEGNPKLNLAFVANLFNLYPGLEPLSDVEKAKLDEGLFASQGDREARAFALWLNSLGVDPFVNNLYDDVRDGIVLLQAFDRIHPGCVEWKKVNQKIPLSRFKQVENTNYAVVLGKSFKYSLVGIQGADITDGIKKLILALVWQMMRDNVIQILETLSKNGKAITDADMIAWANSTVKKGGKSSSISSFKDSSLKTGVFLLDLIAGIKKGIVDYNLVTPGEKEEDAKMNAKYAISIARKLGATLFLLPDDILEVKPKMILTFIGALMAVDYQMMASH